MEIQKKRGENDLLMRATKKFGRKKAIIRVCILTGVLILMAGNFIVNCLYNTNLNLFYIFLFRIDLIFTSIPYALIYLVDFIFIAFVDGKLAWKLSASFQDMNIGQKGTSRWTTPEEIKAQYKAVPHKGDSFPGYGGIPVCRMGSTLYIDDSATNMVCIGITRSGKGEMFVVPMIDLYSRAKKQSSMLILDMKLELYCRAKEILENRGYKVYLINLDEPEKGIRFNPLQLIRDYYIEGNIEAAELLAKSFAYSQYYTPGSTSGENGDFFPSTSTAALTALIMALCEDCMEEAEREYAKAIIQLVPRQQKYVALTEEKKQAAKEYWQKNFSGRFTENEISKYMYIPDDIQAKIDYSPMNKVTMTSLVQTFSVLASSYLDMQTTKLDIFFKKRPASDRSRMLYSQIGVAGDRTKGNIFSTALSKLDIYAFESIENLTCTSDMDLTTLGFGDKPTALFIGVPYYDRSKDTLASSIISQVYQSNARKAARENNGVNQRRIIYHLDEIGNYPAVKDLETMVSVGLGCGNIFNFILQSPFQMKMVYGEDRTETILGNCGNKVFIQTSSLKVAQDFSDLLGKETITNLTRTGEKGKLNKTLTESEEERPLLNANELMELRPGENVIKRVMKRTDLSGNKITPYPIFNSIDRGTGYLFSYEYLNEDFPERRTLKELGICPIKNILKSYYNYNIVLNKYSFFSMKKTFESGDAEAIQQFTQEDIVTYNDWKKYYRYDISICESSISQSLKSQNFQISDKKPIYCYIIKAYSTGTTLEQKEKMLRPLIELQTERKGGGGK